MEKHTLDTIIKLANEKYERTLDDANKYKGEDLLYIPIIQKAKGMKEIIELLQQTRK